MVFEAMRQIWWNLAEIGPAVAEKKALEIERMDRWTDTQSVFIVKNPYYGTDHRVFSEFIKPLTVPTFLPDLVQICQAVAEKWATETFEIPNPPKLFII